ncbi:aspartyl protease family protein [Pedobacter frigoris]|uniref:aspartyl protease family protein n=1 Tax=Pedobacter frigoris TaxID=2571272 RepID=UPI00292F1171|nr:aspartyl protease family protein [Pedobacter frigoris]
MRAVSFFLFKILFISAITLSLAVNHVNAQQFEFSGDRKNQTINFNLVRNLVIVPLYINGNGPFNFILDTGVGPLIITDTSIVKDLNLKKLRPVKINGLGKGLDIDAFISNEIYAKIGKAEIENIPTAILKEDVFALSSYVGVPIHGLLGYYFFNSFVVELNYTGRRLKFHRPETKRRIEGEAIPIEIFNNKPYMSVDMDIPGLGTKSLKVVIDNGASHAISLETLDEKPFPIPPVSIKANLGIGLSGPISGSVARIPSLRIGSFVLNDVISSYPDYDNAATKALFLNRNGNLGAEILTRFNITFDYNNNFMYLKRNYTFKRPFEHDMSGLEVFVDDALTKRFFISRIEPESPAVEAGLLVDDEILSINFTTVGTMTLNDVSKFLRMENGKTLYLAINRKGELLIKLIKLKKRI